MRLFALRRPEGSGAAIQVGDHVVAIADVNSHIGLDLPTELLRLIQTPESMEELRLNMGKLEGIRGIGEELVRARVGPPLTNPPKIWGIGLNYRNHADDLGATWPSEPASFMKPSTTIIGPEDSVILPSDSSHVTAEAELGVVLGKSCKGADMVNANRAILGYMPVLDMTAEDILQKNPRFLTRAKSYDTFLSIGPCIITREEIQDVEELGVSTVINGEVRKSDRVSNMAFSPDFLVSFHSRVFEFKPGDILLTGTPGAGQIHGGDEIECRIDGFPRLHNFVSQGGEN